MPTPVGTVGEASSGGHDIHPVSSLSHFLEGGGGAENPKHLIMACSFQ